MSSTDAIGIFFGLEGVATRIQALEISRSSIRRSGLTISVAAARVVEVYYVCCLFFIITDLP